MPTQRPCRRRHPHLSPELSRRSRTARNTPTRMGWATCSRHTVLFGPDSRAFCWCTGCKYFGCSKRDVGSLELMELSALDLTDGVRWLCELPRLLPSSRAFLPNSTAELNGSSHSSPKSSCASDIKSRSLPAPTLARRLRSSPMCPEALRLRGSCVDQVALHVMMLERVAAASARVRRHPFSYIATSLSGNASAAARSACDNAARAPRPGRARGRSTTSSPICRSCPSPMRSGTRCPTRAGLRRCITVCHRVCSALCPTSGTYLAFLGRISPEKRVDRAIAIATASGLPLKIAAKVDPADQDLLRTYHRPAAGQSARRIHRRDFRKGTRTPFSARRKPCSSPSTGPSRSGWS